MSQGWEAWEADSAVQPPQEQPTTLINLHFMATAVLRHRLLIACCALIGLVSGLAIAVVSPPKHVATASVLLTRDPSEDPDRAVATDLALAATNQVAGAVASKLQLNVTAPEFAKTITVTKVTDDVLRFTVTGPTDASAITRATDVVTEFLKYRGDTLTEQSKVIVTTLGDQISELNAQVATLTNTINSTSSTKATALSDLISQRSQITTQVAALQSQVQNELLSASSITATSRILDPATSHATSKIKGFVVDAVGGLVIGGALSILLTVIAATLSWRARRREDVADAIDAPVKSLRMRRRLNAVDRKLLTGLVEEHGARGRALGWVATQTPRQSARLLLSVAKDVSATGRQVLLVDLSDKQWLARESGRANLTSTATSVITVTGEVALSQGPLRPGPTAGYGMDHEHRDRYDAADVILALVTVDPALGAEHLASWVDSAIITVAAGATTPETLHTTAQLIRVAGISVTAGLLFNADRTDESLGLPRAGRAAQPLVRAVAQ